MTRKGNRIEALLKKAGRARDPLERLTVFYDFFRGAVKANPSLVSDATLTRLEELLEVEGMALYEAAARNANKEANTPRRRTA